MSHYRPDLAVGAVRDQVDAGEARDVMARQVGGDLPHAILIEIEQNGLHTVLQAFDRVLRVWDIGLDEDDLAGGGGMRRCDLRLGCQVLRIGIGRRRRRGVRLLDQHGGGGGQRTGIGHDRRESYFSTSPLLFGLATAG